MQHHRYFYHQKQILESLPSESVVRHINSRASDSPDVDSALRLPRDAFTFLICQEASQITSSSMVPPAPFKALGSDLYGRKRAVYGITGTIASSVRFQAFTQHWETEVPLHHCLYTALSYLLFSPSRCSGLRVCAAEL